MNSKTVYLAWQDAGSTRMWFPVGRLDADVARARYRFRYIAGAKRAQLRASFPLLFEFPKLERDYVANELFPLFRNRVMNARRPSRSHYLEQLGLGPDADPIEILSTSGGRRVTDAYEVFPKIVKGTDGSFSCRFFLHGWRHVSDAAKERLTTLQRDDPLYVTLELTNPRDQLAVQIQTTDYHMIGWAPRYLVGDLAKAVAEHPLDYAARVVRPNPPPAPSSQRLLVEMRGKWQTHEPMSGEDYKPLVGEM